MKIFYGKQLNNDDNIIVNDISTNCNINKNIAKLLFYRGISNVENAKKFLNPGKNGFINPFLLSGMKEAVSRIEKAKYNNEKVLIFGDYDADGICATTVLYYSLKNYGILAKTLIPERDNGYGLNIDLILNSFDNNKPNLVITVDCGISDYDKIEMLKNKGIDFIVTDHHEPPEILPDCITINPKIKGQDYNFDKLCGAGVAYKLSYSLIGELADNYLDFVALATVADSMDLIGENRDIVFEGLKIFNNNLRPCFKKLLNDNVKEITSQTLAYSIAPRINAGGRMGDANCALSLFISENPNTVFDKAVLLNEYNITRQAECDNIYKQAKNIIVQEKLDSYEVIIVSNEKWRTGFIGIVAARLVEDYNKPVVVFAENGNLLKGSARSIDGINIYQAILNCTDLLEAFGGHSQAAGVSIKKENLNIFRERISKFISNNYSDISFEKNIYVDMLVEGPFPSDFARQISMLEPFGTGNKKPLFAVREKSLISDPLKLGSPHFSFKSSALNILDFNGEKNVELLSLDIDKYLIFEVNVSMFNGRESIKGYLKKIVLDFEDIDSLRYNSFYNLLNGYNDYLIVPKIINHKDIKIEKGNSTLYLLFNPENIKYYDLSNLEKYYKIDDSGNNVNKILIGAVNIPVGYNKLVYLDRPLSFFNYDCEIYCSDILAFTHFNQVSIDRDVFADYYNKFSMFDYVKIRDIVEFVKDNFEQNKIFQALFCFKVFIELGFFYLENGFLRKNNQTKTTLTNSKLYCKIKEILY